MSVDNNGNGVRTGGQEDISRLKDHFLASLNHEIRTPLTGILGMTDLLLETGLSEEQKEYVLAARGCADGLLDSLNALLEYSTLSAGDVRLEDEEFHIASLLEETVREFQVRAEAKGLRFVYLPHANLSRITTGDSPRVRQILRQLLSNAVKFTMVGEVEVMAACRGSRLEVSVRDTGIGVSPEDLSRIFDSFRQLESGLSRRYAGLGLGLALAQKLTVLLGGEIRASSTLGVGSQFQFWIPIRQSEHDGAPAAPPRPRHLPRRVLVVEDNRLAQTVIRHVLHKRKYQVECVGSGEEALDVLRAEQVGLVLMDLQMPGMTGIEAAVRVQQLPNGQGVPILALTANASDDYRIRCREAGMKEFLSKPIQPEELLRAVGRHLP